MRISVCVKCESSGVDWARSGRTCQGVTHVTNASLVTKGTVPKVGAIESGHATTAGFFEFVCVAGGGRYIRT